MIDVVVLEIHDLLNIYDLHSFLEPGLKPFVPFLIIITLYWLFHEYIFINFCFKEKNFSRLKILKVGGIYLWQFDEQKDQVAGEQILRVVFLDPERPCPVSQHFSNND